MGNHISFQNGLGSYSKKGMAGDVLTAEANEVHNGKSTGLYEVKIHNQRGQFVALFKGVCFRTERKVVQG